VADELISGMQPPVGTPHPVERLILVPGSRGIFEVRKDGSVIFSKESMGRKPKPGEIYTLVNG
jgi:hypothetical protein